MGKMNFDVISSTFKWFYLNELVDYIMRDWKKTALRKCEEPYYLQTKVSQGLGIYKYTSTALR